MLFGVSTLFQHLSSPTLIYRNKSTLKENNMQYREIYLDRCHSNIQFFSLKHITFLSHFIIAPVICTYLLYSVFAINSSCFAFSKLCSCSSDVNFSVIFLFMFSSCLFISSNSSNLDCFMSFSFDCPCFLWI